MWFVGNGIKGDPGKCMANLLNERKRKRCLYFEFNAAFNNFSVISWQCMVVAGSCSMLILNSAASLKYHAPDTWHGTTLINVILKRGQPALALPNKSASSISSNLWPPVPGSRGYTEGDKKRYAITLLSILTEFKFLFFFTFSEVQRVELCRKVPDTVLMKHITEKGSLAWPVKFLNHDKDHYDLYL